MVSIARRGRTYSRKRRNLGLGLGFRLRVPTNANLTPTLTKARRYIRSMPFKPPIPPEKIYPNANPLAIEMLQARYLVITRRGWLRSRRCSEAREEGKGQHGGIV